MGALPRRRLQESRPLKKTFQFVFGDLVAVHMPKEKRTWKFDLRWDVGIYVGQPESSVEAALVFFPYKGQLLVRTDVARLNITDEAYRRYYSKRFDIYGSNRSTSTRIHQRLEEAQWDFAQPLHDPGEVTESQPLTEVNMAEPEEIPQHCKQQTECEERKHGNVFPHLVSHVHVPTSALCHVKYRKTKL